MSINKTTVIHQADFLPYLGFFHRLLYADLFIILDDVQFLRRGWQHRDKIKTIHDEKWLTINIEKSPQKTNINEVYIKKSNWKEEHLNTIKQYYKKTEFYEEIIPFIERLYSKEHEKLIDFNLDSIYMLIDIFKIDIQIEFSSKYQVKSKSNQLLVDLLKATNSNIYLSGVGAKDYFIQDVFDNEKIKVIWQNFIHPEYTQINGKFIPYLSSIDLLFNCGITNSRKILRNI